MYLSAPADGIFTISFTADQYARVWIDHPGGNVTAVADRRSIEGRPNDVTLTRTRRPRSCSKSARRKPVGTTLRDGNFPISAEPVDPEDTTTESTPTSLNSNDDEHHRETSTTVTAENVNKRRVVATNTTIGTDIAFDVEQLYRNGSDVVVIVVISDQERSIGVLSSCQRKRVTECRVIFSIHPIACYTRRVTVSSGT